MIRAFHRMMTGTAIPRALSAAALCLALAAAPATAQDPAAPALPTEGLEERAHPGLETVMVRPGVDLGQYKSVLIAPVALTVTRERDQIALQDRDANHAKDYFTRRLTEAFGAANLTTQPGPGVLRLEVTITEFVPNSPAIAQRQDRLGGVNMKSYSIGAAAFQAVLRDAESGQVVAVLADADVGLPFGQNMNLTTQYGDADKFLRRWAGEIARLVEGKAAS